MNKSVLITGATSGIGEACSKAFAASGYSLILTGRSQEKLNILQEQLAKNGAKVKTLTFDVRNREETAQALASLTGEWADIDILVNNAGLALGLDKLHEGDFEDWDIMIDTNIKGLLNVTRMVVPMMVKRNKGHIINIGSVAGDVAYSMGNVYCATKAAVKALTDGLRIDLVNTPIKVTNVKPGLVETNFSITRFHGNEAQAKNVYQGIKPLSGEDIADTILYIANAPTHVQIAEILVLPTHQANGYTVWRNNE
ncbi:MAG: SDR family NAD(P)-dependent oxidoreductase [Prevotella sp.]|nr:SDR family NAD(P)-dependent oxidoreductase [Prevotella sp.]